MLHFGKIPKKFGQIWRKFSKILEKFATFWKKTAKFQQKIQQFLTKILRLETGTKECIRVDRVFFAEYMLMNIRKMLIRTPEHGP